MCSNYQINLKYKDKLNYTSKININVLKLKNLLNKINNLIN